MSWIFLFGLLDLIHYLPCGYKLVTSFIQGIYTCYKNVNKIQVDKNRSRTYTDGPSPVLLLLAAEEIGCLSSGSKFSFSSTDSLNLIRC